MSGKTIGLTGATGFVGGHVVKELLSRGYAVRCIARSPEAAGWLRARGVAVFKGDITEQSSIDPAFFEKLPYLIHLVGIIKERGTQTFQSVHFKGTKTVVDMAKQSGGIKKYVHMSALGTRPDAGSRYHRTKWEAEEYVRASGLKYTVFRPSIIYGPGGEFIDTFIKIIKLSPVLPAISSGTLYPIHVRDVAWCFAEALERKKTDDKTVPLGGPGSFSLKEMMGILLKVLGKERIVLPIPSYLLYPQAALLERVLKNPPLTTDQLKMLAEEAPFDSEEVTAILHDFSPVSFEEGLKEYLS